MAMQLEVSPIVYDGIIYVTSSYNRLFALDAVTGKLLWRYDHQMPKDLRICCGPVNRGPAIAGDNVLMATLDARLIAFDRKSGKIVWNVEIAPYDQGLSATSAPLDRGRPRGGRHRRWRVRRPRLLRRLRHQDRRAPLAPLHGAGGGRARRRDLGRRLVEERRLRRPG